jgi:hypothetical protein
LELLRLAISTIVDARFFIRRDRSVAIQVSRKSGQIDSVWPEVHLVAGFDNLKFTLRLERHKACRKQVCSDMSSVFRAKSSSSPLSKQT